MVKNLIRTCLFFLALAASVVASALLFRAPMAAALSQDNQSAPATNAATVSAVRAAAPVWRVCVRGTGTAELYSSQGDWMQSLDFADGETLTMAMPPGDYCLLRPDDHFVSFRLAQNAAISMLGGQGWTDGEILYMEDVPGGSIQVVCWLTPEEFDSGQYGICWLNLYGEELLQSTALHFVPELEPEDNGYYCQSWNFQGLPPGTYTLEKDGQPAAIVTLTDEEPDYMLVLGGGK